MPQHRIRVSEVRIGSDEERLVLEVLRSGHLAQGPVVERLEEHFRSLTGTSHAVALNSGTTALVATLQSIGIEPGDEVVTSPFTFVATLNAILQAGAVARFADIGPDFNVLPDSVDALIGPRTRALLPVHLYGQPADMTSIEEIATRHGLTIVEDAAQAVGARVGTRRVGSFGVGCFSLYATKNITSGEGGMVTTDDESLADRLRVLRNQGMRARYEYVSVGHNYRLTDLQAAVAVGQVSHLEDWTRARQRNALALTAAIEGTPGLLTPITHADREHVYHQYTLRVTDEALMTRDEAAHSLGELGIETGIYYPRAVFDYPTFREHPRVANDPCPNAHQAAGEVLSLPVHPHLEPGDLDLIIESVLKTFGT